MQSTCHILVHNSVFYIRMSEYNYTGIPHFYYIKNIYFNLLLYTASLNTMHLKENWQRYLKNKILE